MPRKTKEEKNREDCCAEIDSIQAELESHIQEEGVRGPLLEHIKNLKDRITAGDVWGALDEFHSLLGHILGKEGMRGDGVSAPAWLLPLLKKLFEVLIKAL